MDVDNIATLTSGILKENNKNTNNKPPYAAELRKTTLENTEMVSSESCDVLQSETVTAISNLKTSKLAESTNNIEVGNNSLLQRSAILSEELNSDAQTTNIIHNKLEEKSNLVKDVNTGHRRLGILDSDSDNESDSYKENSDTMETSSPGNTKIHKRLTILDSDSEIDESPPDLKTTAGSNDLVSNDNHQNNDKYNIENEDGLTKSRIHKRSALVDSDSETEEITPLNKSFNNDNDVRIDTEIEANAENRDGPKKSRIYKISALLDSDSETEEITPHNKSFNNDNDVRNVRIDTEIEANAENRDGPKKSRIHKRSALLDSDSETEEITPHNKCFDNDVGIDTEIEADAENRDGPKKSRIHKRSALVDSDSETEEIMPHNKSFNDDNDVRKDMEIEENDENRESPKKSRIHKRLALEGSDSEMEEITPHNKSYTEIEDAKNKAQKSRLSLLCDSDSDEEVRDDQAKSSVLSDDEIIEQSQFGENINKRFSKSNHGSKARKNNIDEQHKKMTAKDAAVQRKEIQSESQRMLREKNVSLPYHKPKTHNIKEFLARRSRLAVTTASGRTAPPSVAIKMSSEQLEVISKKLKEREKEVKEFYKSESESDGNGDDGDYIPADTNQPGEEKKEITSNLVDQENNLSADADKVATSEMEGGNDKEKCDVESMEIGSDAMEITDDVQNDIDIASTPIEAEPMETSEIVQKESENVEEPCIAENTDVTCQESTENYDFNLDDVNTEKLTIPSETFSAEPSPNKEKDVEENTDLETTEVPTKSFDYDDLDKEIENFGNPEPSPPVISKLDLLKKKLANIQPRLSGGPDEVIDLDSGGCEPKEVVELMKRFAKHVSAKKHVAKHKVSLSIVTVESGGDIHKETVAMNVDDDEDTKVQEEKPGAKLQRLKEGLQKQMDQKKAEMWQQKAAKGLRGSEETVGGEEKTGYEDDILYDDEEEAEMTEDEDTEEEIEDDVELEDKPVKKSAFLDQEAEESETEETESHKDDYEEDLPNENEDKNEDQNSKDCDDVDSEINADNDENSNMSSEPPEVEADSSGKKKVLKRIIKPQEDSDEEDLFSDLISQKPNYNEQLDSTVTADEEDIPPHQPRQLQTPIRAAISQTNSISNFLTPISFITSIQNLTSAKSNKNGPSVSPFRMPSDLSPNKEERATATQKKLFTDSQMLDSQGSLSIPTTQTQESLYDLVRDNETVPSEGVEEEPPSTQDLMNICSGEFTGVTQLEPSEDSTRMEGTQSLEFKSLGSDQDMVISQLIDEEELEVFKKKFESPVNPVTQRSIGVEAQEIKGGGIIDSDDDDVDEIEVKQRKNQRKIQFSDDDSSDEEKEDSEGEIVLQDKDDIDEGDIDNIGYDSEENEVDLNDIGQKKEKLKMTDFFEAEAELSESEWGSEDEDEKDLDKLEFELGDTEKFDEEQVKEDLERIHMRRMLDDDAREVKLLQEVYLEDGEMHGTGRQRQFKWKNIDSIDGDDATEDDKKDEDIYLDEEENEEHWRKKRHEREMFFKEKSQQKSRSLEVEDESILNQSQLLKIGQKVLQRSTSANNSQNGTPLAEKVKRPASPVIKSTLTLLSKRGSFLSRSDQVLQRVAEYTKLTTDISTNSSKTNKNFVFHSVSALEVSVAAAEIKKRKAEEGTPKVIKKLRLNTNLSPAVKKKTPLEKAKQLFNF